MPVFAERLPDQVGILRRMNAVDQVVARHNGTDAGFDGRLEGREIDFVDGPFVRDGIRMMPVILLVVQGEMLYRRHHALRLDALDVGSGRPGGKKRVLPEILEVPPAERTPADVHAGTQQDVNPASAGILSQGGAHLPDQRGIPGRRRGHPGSIQLFLLIYFYIIHHH